MRAVFMGSAELSCPSLVALMAHADVVGVVTQPDRPRGRKLTCLPCIVKARALDSNLTVLTPSDVNDPEAVSDIAALEPDVIVVVAYGQILRQALLELPVLGCINVHTSLLPRYRGAAPIQWAIANGEEETGVTTMYMDAGMDTGDIILQRPVPIGPEETAGILHDRLGIAGAELLTDTLQLIEAGNAPRVPQDHRQATVARRLSKADGRIEWSLPAGEICCRIRGFNPWPGSFTMTPGGRLLKVMRAVVESGADAAAIPGTVRALDGAGPVIWAGRASVRLLEVQPEGGKVMPAEAYLRGHALRLGDRLE